MGVLYIAVILMCRFAQHLYEKKTSLMVEGVPELLRFNGIRQCISAALALALIIVGGNGLRINAPTLLLSLLSGTMLASSISFSLYAMKTGMVSLVALFGTAGMIIPCLTGVFLFNTPIAAMQWVGFAMFMFAAYLMIMGSRVTVKGFSVKTVLFLIGVMLADGLTMMAQQMFTQYVPDGDVSAFSFLSFGIVGIVMLAAVPFAKGKREMEPMPKSLIAYSVILAAALLIINQLATLATAIVPPVILFTFINGGSTVIAAIVAATVYKEKLTVRSTAGIILGVLSFVIIKAFEL